MYHPFKRTYLVCLSLLLPFASIYLLVLPANVILGAPPSFQTIVQGSGPLLYYQLNETVGYAINYGSLGPACDGQYFGAIGRNTATAGGDSGITLDSGDDYLESLAVSPPSLSGNPSFSIEVVVYLGMDSYASYWPPFMHWGDGGASRDGREVYFGLHHNDPRNIYAGFFNGGMSTNQPLSLGQWYHLVMVRQGGGNSATGTSLYVNGQNVALIVDPDLSPGVLVPAIIASTFRINRAREGNRYFTGILDEVAVYDRVLTTEEIDDHFAALGLACLNRPTGDINLDCRVDLTDLALLTANWLECGRPNPSACW